MSQGYDKFFKTAQKVRAQEPSRKLNVDLAMEDLRKQQSVTPEDKLRKAMRVKKARRKSRFPWSGLILTAAVSAVLGWWSVNPNFPDQILSHLDVAMMGQAVAESSSKVEKPAAPKDQTKAKAATSEGTTAAQPEVAPAAPLPEELSHLEKLRVRSQTLDQREKELNQLEEELQRQKEEIEVRIHQLEELRAQITNVLKDRVEVDQEKVMKLVDTYSNMKPKQAAEILAGIDEDLAVEVLGKMKKKNAAEIMNLLEPGKARSISEKYAGFKSR